MLGQCENIKKLAGDDKYLIVDIAGPFTNACVMRETELFMLDIMKNKELAIKLLDIGTEICINVLQLLRERGADIAFIAEPCSSGTMISPKMFKDWVIPRLKQVMDATDFKYYICHVCGGSGKRVKPLMEAGFNAFSCDYAVDLDQALIDADGKMVIYGNINPAGAMLFDEPEDVYKEAEERIKTAAGRGYIMAPGCDMVCDAPFENVMAMPKACKELV
jgi:uroporphyrinogen decarboxylase